MTSANRISSLIDTHREKKPQTYFTTDFLISKSQSNIDWASSEKTLMDYMHTIHILTLITSNL